MPQKAVRANPGDFLGPDAATKRAPKKNQNKKKSSVLKVQLIALTLSSFEFAE